MSADRQGRVSRRGFVKVTGVAGAGLVLGIAVPPVRGALGEALAPAAPFEPNAWLRLATDGSVHFVIDEMEMGQGVVNALPMIVAEELDVDVDSIGTEYGPRNPSAWPRGISTGGSTTVRTGWEPIRTAAAQAREMLKAAAAERLGVPASSLGTERGQVVHAASGRRIPYGDLVDAAAALPVPEEVPFKDPSEYRILGTYVPRHDTPGKVDGSKKYAMDLQLPDMKVATVARSPVFGGTVRSFKDSGARQASGVRDVVQISSGVAVVGDDTWSAIRGREALEVEWDEGALAGLSSPELMKELRELAYTADPAVARTDGDAAVALTDGTKVEADYQVPYLAHSCMEPMNCTAHVRSDGAEIWAPTQAATSTQQVAAEITGLPVESVVVHSLPMGGGFGRRSNVDFVREAVEVAAEVDGPVKVVWTREDDTRGGFYRSVAYHRFQAALGDGGMPTAWDHQVGAPSLISQINPGGLERTGGWDFNSLLGARDLPYAIPNIRVAQGRHAVKVPMWWWRSVGHSHNAYATECFMDELAGAAGVDPVDYRRELLTGEPRLWGVLERAAQESGWGRDPASGRALGVACHICFGSYIAQVAEVSVEDDGRVVVHRVTAAVDAGQVINPNTVEAQIQGAIVYALGAALYGKITLENGRVQQSNFHDYPMLRMPDMPEVDVHIVDSREAPGGIGEVGTPPLAPAVVNAVAAATGVRIRSLPIDTEKLRRV